MLLEPSGNVDGLRKHHGGLRCSLDAGPSVITRVKEGLSMRVPTLKRDEVITSQNTKGPTFQLRIAPPGSQFSIFFIVFTRQWLGKVHSPSLTMFR